MFRAAGWQDVGMQAEPTTHPTPRRVRVGLTGGIASGKTLVAQMLADRGAHIIDSDILAREVVEPGTPGLAAVVERFGEGVLRADGTLDRAKLGAIIFGDDEARADLNAIVHPLVRKAGRAAELATPPDAIVVHVIPLLVETNQQHKFDLIVVVDVDQRTQLRRLMKRNGLTEDEALARLAAQASRQERLDAADLVIDNAGVIEQTRYQVEEVWDIVCRVRDGEMPDMYRRAHWWHSPENL